MNNNRNNENIEIISKRYIEVVQRYNITRAYFFMHSYLSNNLTTWSEEANIPYFNDAQKKFLNLAEDEE